MRCSCGVWVCPAFSLGKGRVDEVPVKSKRVEGGKNEDMGEKGVGNGEKDGFRIADVGGAGNGGGAGIRLPPGMKGRGNL